MWFNKIKLYQNLSLLLLTKKRRQNTIDIVKVMASFVSCPTTGLGGKNQGDVWAIFVTRVLY